jgi:hypothetical protein
MIPWGEEAGVAEAPEMALEHYHLFMKLVDQRLYRPHHMGYTYLEYTHAVKRVW